MPKELSKERKVILHLKGSPEYADWLSELSEATSISKAMLVRKALKEYVTRNGWAQPPKQ